MTKTYPLNPAQIALQLSHRTAFLSKDGQEVNQLNFYFLVKDNCNLAALEKAYFQLFEYNVSLNLMYKLTPFGYRQYLPENQIKRESLKIFEFKSMEEFRHFTDVESYNFRVDVVGKNPIRACLAKIGDAGALVVRASHLLFDGFSMSLLYKQLESAYLAFEQNLPAPVIKTGSVIDCFEEYRKYMHSESYLQDKAFWKKLHRSFPDFEAVVPYMADSETVMVPYSIGGEVYEKLKALSESSMMSVEYLMQYMTSLLIYRKTGKKCFSYLSLTHGRRNFVQKRTVGCLYEDIILYFDFDDSEDFMTSLRRHYTRYMDCLVHGRMPLKDHIRYSFRNTVKTRNAEQYSWMIFSNMGYVNALSNPRFSTGTMHPTNQTWHFFLGMFDVEAEKKILFEVEYATKLYTSEQVVRLGDELKKIMKKFLGDPSARIGEIHNLDS